ncbi:MAG: hypothetical protein K8T20_10310 [Planctomycetes bacterium]|nr:hypothetical protein [Planctomycetota bacterium]
MLVRALLALVVAASFAVAGDPPPGPSAADAKVKVDALKAAKDAESKKKAIVDAACCPHPTVAAALSAYLADPSDDMRIAAAYALSAMKGLADAAKALGGGIAGNAAKPEVLKQIFDAIGKVGRVEAIPAVREWTTKHVPIKDEKDSDLAVAGINALTAVKSKASVEGLLELYKKQVGIGMSCSAGIHASVYSAITGGLKALTGQTFNSMPGEAELWWRKNKDTFNDDLTKK